jgi:hypothetical protein
LFTASQRCKSERWYLIRVIPAGGIGARAISCSFRGGDDAFIAERAVLLRPVGEALCGWVYAPTGAEEVAVYASLSDEKATIGSIDMHAIAELDPKCHPLANTPPWNRYPPPFPIREVIAPDELAWLTGALPTLPIRVTTPPDTYPALKHLVQGRLCMLGDSWVRSLRLSLEEVEALADRSIVVVDLHTFARLITEAEQARTEVETLSAPHELMSARVDYADFCTRGFALQDVFPYGYLNCAGEFAVRFLRATKSWKKYADANGFATILSSETPWEDKHGDVLLSARPTSGGELIVTDLPWLAAGNFGRPLAPQLTLHLTRMLCGADCDAGEQYWTRWADAAVVLRDIAEMTRKYPPLRGLRWTGDGDLVRLGLMMPASGLARATLLVRTGRIDGRADHHGVPPEPMMIWMKRLAQRTSAAHEAGPVKAAANTHVVWQFESAEGQRYAGLFASAADALVEPVHAIDLRMHDSGSGEAIELADEGLLGDGSLATYVQLASVLNDRLSRLGR